MILSNTNTININSIISLGGGCDAMFFSSLLGLRMKGPVDNCGSLNGFNGVIELLDKTLYNSIINDNYYQEDFNLVCLNFNNYVINNHRMVHNDLKLEKTKNELLNRFNILYNYIELSKIDNSMFYIYSFIEHDLEVNCDYNIVLNKIPDYIKNKLLFINTYDHIFDINYPIFKLNHNDLFEEFNKTKKNNDITYVKKYIKIFNNWWKDNKYFYEKLNNCKYNYIEI